jgi:ATP-binding cassette, subfamily B, bacterial PglK
MKSTYINKFLYILGDSSKKIYGLVALFLLSSILDLAGIGLIAPYIALIIDPQAFQQSEMHRVVVGFGLNTELDQLIIVFGEMLVAIFFLKFLSTIYINYKIMDFCYKEGRNVRSKLMMQYQDLPYESFIKRNSSEYIHTIQSKATLYSQSILQALLRLISDGMIAIIILLFLFWQNPYPLMLLVLLLGVSIFLYDLTFRKRITRYGSESNRYSAKMLQSAQEGFDGLKEARVLNIENYFYNSVVDNASKYANAAVNASVIQSIPKVLLELILVVFIVLLVYFSILAGNKADDLLPVLGMFGVAAIRLAPSASQIISSISNIRFGGHTVDTIYKDLIVKSDSQELFIDDGKTNEEFNSLQVKDVNFSYMSSDTPVLKNMSLEIKKGEAIGIIGASGSGKTTLIDLMLGLLELKKGCILYNGKDITKSPSSWRAKVAYIPQNIFLTDESMRKNIALGVSDNKIDNNKVTHSIYKSKLTDLLNTLPNGVDTVLGENGVKLSGGQRQRIALARAFYHEREVLIMDEATSALDNETEAEIINEIQRLKGKKTMIVIAHRLSTIQHCDRIYRLDKGRIVEVGILDGRLNFISTIE